MASNPISVTNTTPRWANRAITKYFLRGSPAWHSPPAHYAGWSNRMRTGVDAADFKLQTVRANIKRISRPNPVGRHCVYIQSHLLFQLFASSYVSGHTTRSSSLEMLLRRPSSPSSTPPSASALLGSSVGAIDPFGSCQTILYTHFLERTCVEEAGSAVEDTHASARPPSSPSEHRSPSFWRRKFKFGATPKPPAPMKKVHHRSHNMWVNK